jgi:hypothetical protein
MVAAPACPAVRLSAFGLAVKLHIGGRVTTSEKATVRVTPPPVAVTVSGYVPPFAFWPTARVRVLLAAAAPLTLAGENKAVTPAGKPETERPTVDENPFCGVMVNDTLLLVPRRSLAVVAVAAKTKVGTGTVSGRERVWLKPPLPVAEIDSL